MSRLSPLPPSSLTPEQAELYTEITTGPRASGPQHFALTADDGSLNGPFNAFLLAPGLGRSLQNLGAAVRYETSLSGRTREIAILLVAARWNSAFERGAHESVGRAVGLTDDELDALRRGSIPALVDAHELACAELVHGMLGGDVGDDDWLRLVTLVGHPTVFELSTLVGYYATLALQLRIFRVDEVQST